MAVTDPSLKREHSRRVIRKLGIGCALIAALAANPGGAAEDPALAARIDAALLRLGPSTIHGVRVLASSSGEVLYERNPDLSLNPASNMKLLTSSAALAKLGPDYRYTTSVRSGREPDRKGKVRGDLFLVGGGDPVLELKDLEALADAVRAAGVRVVTGDLVTDDTRYDSVRLGTGWEWDDEPYYYAAQISALSIDRGCLRVFVEPTSSGQPPRVRVEPTSAGITVRNTALTGAAGSLPELSVLRARGRNEIVVSGTIPSDAAPSRVVQTVEEPAIYAGEVFRSLLKARGVELRGSVIPGKASESTHPVAARQSPPLSEIAALFNKPSDNLIGEMLLKELGVASESVGSSAAGGRALLKWLGESGLPTRGVRVTDGSGLSRHDYVTPRLISELLRANLKQPWNAPFVNSLPIAAVDGTLRLRMAGTRAASNVRAKTGTLANVSALGGYVTNQSGERLVFSILINHHIGAVSAKRVEDQIAAARAESGAAAGR